MSHAPYRLFLSGVILSVSSLIPACKKAEPQPAETAAPASVKWDVASSNALEEHTELIGTTVPLPDHAARVSASVDGRVASIFPGLDPQTAAAATFAASVDNNVLARLASAVAVLSSTKASEGQWIAKGTPMLTLDDTIIKSNLAKLEANQDVLREELLQSQFTVELAQAESDRLGKLSDGLKSTVDVQKADFALKDARSKLNGSRGKLVAGAREIDALRDQLRLYILRAPIDGRVGRLQVAVGQALTAGAPIADIVDLTEQIDVICYVPPAVVSRLRLGQTAEVPGSESASMGAAQVSTTGAIVYIAAQAEPETGNFAVKIRLDNKDNPLRANRVVHVRVQTRPPEQMLSLPASAIMEDEDPPSVLIVEEKMIKNKDGKEETHYYARRLQVILGVRDREKGQVQIVGLEDSEKDPEKKWHGELKEARFIVKDGLGLQTGDEVKLAEDAD